MHKSEVFLGNIAPFAPFHLNHKTDKRYQLESLRPGAHVPGARAIKNWERNSTRGPLGARSKMVKISLFLQEIKKILFIQICFPGGCGFKVQGHKKRGRKRGVFRE